MILNNYVVIYQFHPISFIFFVLNVTFIISLFVHYQLFFLMYLSYCDFHIRNLNKI